ncbi:MAG: DUF348 domain-containing protein [Chloroflexi bacterium]|nr:DUF348 domain-containing protein [Chloroflexota bacterium]
MNTFINYPANPSRHPKTPLLLYLITAVMLLLAAACVPAANTQPAVTVTIWVDGAQKTQVFPAGSTVQAALEMAGIQLNPLDRVSPPLATLLADQDSIAIIRVTEEFVLEETTIPFQRQTVRNESLPEGQTMLIQPGQNGVQQITHRIVKENGLEVSNSVIKSVTLQEALPEIVMVGIQTPFTSVEISGSLVYLTAGSAWLMSETTGNRTPLITSGDLDGRVFSLSPDAAWLLFTRTSQEDGEINALWAFNLQSKSAEPIDLRVRNIVHFADWVPGRGQTIAYSTVEPREIAPGWQANNDLQLLSFNSSGVITNQEEILEANSGGIYGWWGTQFRWSPDGSALAFARPDGIGLVDFENNQFLALEDLIPYQTRGDWAWTPQLDWAPDSSVLYSIAHTPMPGLSSEETSPLFDLSAHIPEDELAFSLVAQTGMFANPVCSPFQTENRYSLAYLQSIFPEQSESSRYRLVIVEQDGSNPRMIFPPDGSPGLEPQRIVWGKTANDQAPAWLGVIYQGNLWLVHSEDGQSQQITGDGSIARVDWK